METRLEHILMTGYKEDMIAHLQKYPEDFEEAIELALGDGRYFAPRAASLLWSSMGVNDSRIQPYVGRLIHILPLRQDKLQRELFKILEAMSLTDEQEGVIYDIALDIWQQIHKKPSVRHTAFRILVKIAKRHPELRAELKLMTQEIYMDSLSAGVRRSVGRLMHSLIG